MTRVRVGVALATAVTFLLSGCNADVAVSEDESESQIQTEVAETEKPLAEESTPEDPEVPQEPIEETPAGAQQVLELACDDEPISVEGSSEPGTIASWDCQFGETPLRVSEFDSAGDLASANQEILRYYADAGDSRTLAELPMLCGPNWRAGFNFNTERDALLSELVEAGITAGYCE